MKKINVIMALLLTLAIAMPLSFSSAATTPPVEKTQLQGEKININTAEEAELTKIPGIGVAKAQKILAYRKANGKFSAFEQLLNVNGIGEKSLKKMVPYMTM